jgi:hypothetical protein
MLYMGVVSMVWGKSVNKCKTLMLVKAIIFIFCVPLHLNNNSIVQSHTTCGASRSLIKEGKYVLLVQKRAAA